MLLASVLAAQGAPTWQADVEPALRQVREGFVNIIVQERAASDAAEQVVHGAGGSVTMQLPIVDGFAATVPASSIDDLASLPSVRVLTLDHAVTVFGDDSPGNTPRSVYNKVVRSEQLNGSSYDGTGVTVALIDTGIADVPDLAGRVLPITDDITGEVRPCVNLSGEPDCADSYGHGTFLAGLIAGNGASSGGKWKGTAPNANLVSIKIAGRDGAADVSNLLAGIQWVVSFRDRYGIKVLNLSLGTDSSQTYRTDPLNYAVERAWDSGIVVVVSASNRGPDSGTIAKPGDDPLVITVGTTDDRGSPGLNDDEVPDFTGRGPTTADGLSKPDIAAPGAHVVSLRAPGSEIDTLYPNTIDGAYRKGSGTSMSAAVVSGLVASVLEARPLWTPDRVKYAITSTTRQAASTDPLTVGAGIPDGHAAIGAGLGLANQGVVRSNGTGTIDLSRGTVTVQADDPMETVVDGVLTTQLLVYDPLAYLGVEWTGARWYGTSWAGARWYGARWYGTTWSGARWYGARWYGESQGARWYGNEWQGARWYGAWE